MAKTTKTTKFKVPKSPSKSHIGSSTGGKKTGCICQKTAAAVASEAQKSEASGDELEHATNCYKLFSFFYCMIRPNQLPRGLACMACTGVSSRTGSATAMTRPLHYVLHYDLPRSTMTCSVPS